MERGKGKGVGGPAQGIGAPSTCTCPKCGAITPHTAGTPCLTIGCPICGTAMVGT